MHFSTILTNLALGASALAVAVTPRQQTSCFEPRNGVCLSRQADFNNATLAITNACNKIPSCSPGQADTARVSGVVRGFPYSAALKVGTQCAGVVPWSTQGCVDAFIAVIDQGCEQQYPSTDGLFQLGYFNAACDSSFVSFNLGG
ncbi:hypothetical protein DPSP01_001346 [Paraphaeosphaeria sporulosa]|uniref:Uncharacterized protein n=1 Tax=Paraphaeosphaeria sporulosa TaxID=1460663 RepID=A0A177C1E9_9PLEO|nr:uncharacterized protein CC84DRAFT_1263501 [Paraphaeosphaeria sporulosa]OAG00547.1 hypothetical protein CC84DRAFT_1263501 [Paraphaeosphaeria sporulosa]